MSAGSFTAASATLALTDWIWPGGVAHRSGYERPHCVLSGQPRHWRRASASGVLRSSNAAGKWPVLAGCCPHEDLRGLGAVRAQKPRQHRWRGIRRIRRGLLGEILAELRERHVDSSDSPFGSTLRSDLPCRPSIGLDLDPVDPADYHVLVFALEESGQQPVVEEDLRQWDLGAEDIVAELVGPLSLAGEAAEVVQ